MIYATIMAGGSGTRFWPASRKLTPKQLLNLTGERSMIQSTADRMQGMCGGENLLIVTNKLLVDSIAQQLPDVPRSSIVGEPASVIPRRVLVWRRLWLRRKTPKRR